MQDPLTERYRLRFGLFEADPLSGTLYRRGSPVHLQDQPFRILLTLLERPASVITREELKQVLWPNGIVVDFDESLNTAVKKLRNALGDSADNPTFIETIPRRGYRFIAPVIDDRAALPVANDVPVNGFGHLAPTSVSSVGTSVSKP